MWDHLKPLIVEKHGQALKPIGKGPVPGGDRVLLGTARGKRPIAVEGFHDTIDVRAFDLPASHPPNVVASMIRKRFIRVERACFSILVVHMIFGIESRLIKRDRPGPTFQKLEDVRHRERPLEHAAILLGKKSFIPFDLRPAAVVQALPETGQNDIFTLKAYVGLLPAHLTTRFVTPEQDAALVTGRIPDIDASDLVASDDTQAA